MTMSSLRCKGNLKLEKKRTKEKQKEGEKQKQNGENKTSLQDTEAHFCL